MKWRNNFDLEDIYDRQRVKLVQKNLKGHATLWWRKMQREWVANGEMRITWWIQMVANMKAKFILGDYEMELFKRFQNLRLKDMSTKDYIEEFYKLAIDLEDMKWIDKMWSCKWIEI